MLRDVSTVCLETAIRTCHGGLPFQTQGTSSQLFKGLEELSLFSDSVGLDAVPVGPSSSFTIASELASGLKD